jgi:hypothetical protein
MFQELGEGTDVIHGEAREALPDGLRRRLNPPKPRGKAKAPRPITCRTAIDQPPSIADRLARRAPNSYMLSGKQMEEAMGMLIIRHKVKDYDKWRPMFDEHSLMQKAAGLSNPRVFRSADDKSEIVVVFDTKDTKRAKDFAASPYLMETMEKAGVMDDPTIFFLESV